MCVFLQNTYIMKNTIIGCFTAFLLSIIACQPNLNIDEPKINYHPLLQHIATKIITASYLDLDNRVDALRIALASLEANPSSGNLEAARQAWRDARLPWEQAECFEIGVTSTKHYSVKIDAWPVNSTDLNNLLTNNVPLSKTYLDAQDGTLKGFHTIEFLLFGTGSKTFSQFTTREFEYLRAAGESLKGDAHALWNEWDVSGNNYANEISTAGNGSTHYASQNSAIQEIMGGIITLSNEIATKKIGRPFNSSNLSLEESQFSANSKADFVNNLQGIQNIYLGSYKGNTAISISDYVKTKDPSIDQRVRTQITQAIDAIDLIPGTFTAAITNNRTAIQNAIDKINALNMSLSHDVLPIINQI